MISLPLLNISFDIIIIQMRWCELEKYGSPEVWNVLTSFCLMATAALSTKSDAIPRIVVFVTGVGSIMFHMSHEDNIGRMIDEMGVLLFSAWYMIHHTTLSYWVTSICCVIVIIWAVLFPEITPFVLLPVICLGICKTENHINVNTTYPAVIALICWLLDFMMCSDYIIFFHGLWHIFISVSVYNLLGNLVTHSNHIQLKMTNIV
jgi:hypothetical protein